MHEIAIRALLRGRCPDMPVSCSHEVSTEIRAFERTATTVLNALLVPVIDRSVRSLRKWWADAGITAPLYLIQPNGAAISPDIAVRAPVKLLLSGPSGGGTGGGTSDRRARPARRGRRGYGRHQQ
ncbi:hypothetical protein P775_12520 [Puniceibacterium antarcticum]|uniref:Hydantoinase A/oxoprolinase domain-containing protein n=1 Tax=Puniceibacterium antarcticum TaxID=1206336 RepID=A0A2G8RE77_9RHOB|nr:hydantoinase/oxoprolinase family protein [Puniceibacterium antarcticum]PIL19896.1 hypothetical protein P775_12520 [Puniceibacterium antarcticum]